MNALRSSFSLGPVLALALFGGAGLAIACSNDNSSPTGGGPPDITGDSGTQHAGGAGGSSATGGAPSSDGGPGSSAGGTASTDGGPSSSGTDGGGGESASGGRAGTGGSAGSTGTGGAPACDPSKTGDHPKACFECAPTKDSDFLNHCTNSDCSPFDNPTRLGAANWNGGKLLPLP